MYKFSKYSTITYDNKTINDLTSQLNFNREMLNNSIYFVNYNIKDGDTPDKICQSLYDDASLDWVLLYINNIIDPIYDWPLLPDELTSYCVNKYGSSYVYSVHHYELDDKVVSTGTTGSTPITNYDYESSLNDAKRPIKLPTEKFMNEFIFSYENL